LNVQSHAPHTLTLPPSPREARSELARLLAERCWPGDVDAVLLVVHEAIVNAHSHAGGPRQVRVWFEGDTVMVELSDGGPGFDVPQSTPMPDPRAESGRGLWLMRQMADQVEVRRDPSGSRLRLSFAPGRGTSGDPGGGGGSETSVRCG
jgi:serine/threonine-protein kinase RsbW